LSAGKKINQCSSIDYNRIKTGGCLLFNMDKLFALFLKTILGRTNSPFVLFATDAV